VTALCSALIEGSVLDVQELVRSLHGGQGQETLSMATFELLLSPTSCHRLDWGIFRRLSMRTCCCSIFGYLTCEVGVALEFAEYRFTTPCSSSPEWPCPVPNDNIGDDGVSRVMEALPYVRAIW